MANLQNIIALCFDFDYTLSPLYMQEPLFKKYNVNGNEFWKEKNDMIKKALEKGINYDDEIAYLNQIIKYVNDGTFKDLSNV